MQPKFSPELAKLGFKKAEAHIRPRLTIGADGKPKSGKSHLALSMPGPIGYINFDRGLEHLLAQCKRSDVMLKDYTQKMPTDGEWEQKGAAAIWKDFSITTSTILKKGLVRSLVIDTATEIWEIIRWGAFGKLDHVKPHHYTAVNGPYRRFINEFQHHNVNLLLLHKIKEKWANDAKGQPQPTGEWERDGFRGTAYAMEINALMERVPETGDFRLEIYDSGIDASHMGQEFLNDDITFQDIAQFALPGINPKEWKV